MDTPSDFLSIFKLLDPTHATEVAAGELDPARLNESAEFLLHKVTWDKVIESGRSTEWSATALNPSFTLSPEEFSTALAMNAVLKPEKNLGASQAFDEFIAAEHDALGIARPDQPCAPGG